MRLTDTHCHLDFEPLYKYREFVLNSCRSAGISRFIIPSTKSESWSTCIQFTTEQAGVYAALGLHPVFIEKHSDLDLENLDVMLSERSEKIIAIGETGLDRRYANEKRQIELYRAHVELAQKHKLPLIVHSVGRHQEIIKHSGHSPVQGVVHAFSGVYDEAKRLIDCGFLLGVGSVILRNSAKTRDAIKRLPLECLLLETDAPDMFLPTSKSKVGTPFDCLAVLSEMAVLKGVSRENLALQLEQNCETLFFER